MGSSSTQTYSKGSDGCVVCPTAPACPECAEDENCVLTALTCDSCPYTYCAKKTSSSISILSNVDANGMAINSSNTTTSGKSGSGAHVHVGGLVSGVVVGSVVAFTLLLLLYYWRRHKRLSALKVAGKGAENGAMDWDSNVSDNDDLYLEDLDDDDDDDDDDEEEEEDDDNEARNRTHAVPQMYGRHPLEDIIEEEDSGEENTRPRAERPGRIEQFRLKPMRPLKAASDTQSIYSSNTIHTKASSNILPIAYIPGVTINQGRAHGMQDDIRSHITLGSSILGEDSSIHLADSVLQQPLHHESPTTAIRARPKLVSLDRDEIQSRSSTDTHSDDSFTVDLDISMEDPFNDRNEMAPTGDIHSTDDA